METGLVSDATTPPGAATPALPEATTQPAPEPAAAEPMVCGTCARDAAAEGEQRALLTWSRGMEGGRSVWTCDGCSREHLRSIEGKLDSTWW